MSLATLAFGTVTIVTGHVFRNRPETGMMIAMGGFGERLRRERESRGITLADISESTKIGSHFLKALEEDHFDKLPGGVFNRGFVRAYSIFLGLDEDEFMEGFETAVAAHQAELIRLQPPPPEPPPKAKKLPNLPVAVGAALLLLIACGAWFLLHRAHDVAGDGAASIAPAREASPPIPLPAAPKAVPQKKAVADTPRNPVSQTPKATGEKQPSHRNSANETTSGDADHSPIENNPVAEPRTPSPGTPIRVELRTVEESWVSVVGDGKVLMEGVLPPDKWKTFRAQKNMVLKTGNAGGVELSYNGRQLPVLGKSKEVKSLTFTSEGQLP
jgi:cytoskeleton protein RodZ